MDRAAACVTVARDLQDETPLNQVAQIICAGMRATKTVSVQERDPDTGKLITRLVQVPDWPVRYKFTQEYLNRVVGKSAEQAKPAENNDSGEKAMSMLHGAMTSPASLAIVAELILPALLSSGAGREVLMRHLNDSPEATAEA